LHYYDNLATGGDRPKIFVVITGKGPEKEKYMEKIRNMSWNYVLIITAWLEAEDYPKVQFRNK
jgi:beta-1,4-mannosyltransferase